MTSLDWRLGRTLLIPLLAPSLLLKVVWVMTLFLLIMALLLVGLDYKQAGWVIYLMAWFFLTMLLLAAPTELSDLSSRKTWLLLGNTLRLATIAVATLGLIWALLLIAPLSQDWGFAAAVSGASAVYFFYSVFCWLIVLRRFEITYLIYIAFTAMYFSGLLPLEWITSNWWLGFSGMPVAVWGWRMIYQHTRRSPSAPVDTTNTNPFPYIWGGSNLRHRVKRVSETCNPLALLLTPARTFITWRLTSLLVLLVSALGLIASALGVMYLAPIAFSVPGLAQLEEIHLMLLSGCVVLFTLLNFVEQQRLFNRRLRSLWLFSEYDRKDIIRLWATVSRHTLALQCLCLAAAWLALQVYFSPGSWLTWGYLLAALLALAQYYWQPRLLNASNLRCHWQCVLSVILWALLSLLLWWSDNLAVVAAVFLPALASTLWLRRLAGQRLQRLDFRRAVA